MSVRAKKHLGQHFLRDEAIAQNIAKAIPVDQHPILEIGPGMGVLTKFLLPTWEDKLFVAEIDTESVEYLQAHYPQLSQRILEGDFLRMRLPFEKTFHVIGNFPYNISSQIFFKVLDHREQVGQVVGMLQKEVAQRLASPPGNKAYGILSVFLQAYFQVEYLFTVPPHVFDPPPKVDSGVIRLVRNDVGQLNCDEKLFFRVVKQGFNNRRKTLRNALKSLNLPTDRVDGSLLQSRAEQMSVADFVELTNSLDPTR